MGSDTSDYNILTILSLYFTTCIKMTLIYTYTVRPVIRGHIKDKENVVL